MFVSALGLVRLFAIGGGEHHGRALPAPAQDADAIPEGSSLKEDRSSHEKLYGHHNYIVSFLFRQQLIAHTTSTATSVSNTI